MQMTPTAAATLLTPRKIAFQLLFTGTGTEPLLYFSRCGFIQGFPAFASCSLLSLSSSLSTSSTLASTAACLPPLYRWGRRSRRTQQQKSSSSNPPIHQPRIRRWTPLCSMHSSPSSFSFDPKQPLFAFPKPLPQLLLRSSLQSPLLLDPLQGEDCIRTTDEPSSDVPFWIPGRVFGDDPSWFSSIFRLEGTVSLDPVDELGLIESEIREYNELRKRQLKVETESWENAVEEYKKLLEEMCHNKLAPNLPFFKSLIVGWFEPFRDAIAAEQKLQEQKKHKTAYGPYIGLLPADKMAVIVMHKILGLLMSGQYNGCIRVVLAATYIGDAIEQEARIHSFLEKTKKSKRKKVDDDEIADQSKEQDMLRKRVENLMKKQKCKELQKVLKVEGGMESWGQNARVKLGSRLIHLLIETACMLHQSDQLCDGPPEIRPAFKHSIKTIIKEPGRGCARKCGVIECDLQILQGLDKAARHSVIPYMPMLIPPRSWKCYNDGGYLFIPSYVIRTHGSKKQQEAIRHAPCKQLSTVFEALDTLGRTKWRVNRRVLDVLDSLWAKGECVAGLVDHENIPIPEKPDSEDASELQKWSRSVRKAQKINAERFSQRCDIELKLSVARKMMKEEGFYYPHNLDFRGRAYPMHPHLSHLNSDLCRGVLEFAEGRSLGKSGLHWLKIHLANLYAGGIEKLSFDGRLSFVENHLRDIFDSAERPIDGERWWLTAEDPLQCLAACMNLSDALKSPSPHHVISHLPVHQDGSCNGLQHYAALGRDSLEAAAVNLVANEKPADVYSGIAARVHDIMKRDSMKDPATDPTALLARILLDQVDRKLVKQTVMTSVYGVTYVGAREQIKRRLVEKGHITDDNVLFHASCYAAKVTLTAIGEKFQAARDIMKWLGDCAKVITSQNQPVRWTTPLGLPVVQPYRKSERHAVRTSLQVLSLQREGSLVDVKRQRTAFPPNFVHSLDGSHMMMTAIACGKAGLHFAGVHDSYWTHACDVDKMNVILRAKFVELYSKPVLENLFESFQTSFPTLHFPTMPNRGNFDMHEVLGSPYFFN